jgi:hypothetical protein
MAWGYRNRRRYYRRRYYRRGYGSKTSRRAYGNMKAARQQADNATFTLNVPSKICSFMKSGAQLPGLAVGETRTVGVYPISIYELLRRNEFFNNYANMYDEFKIDKIKVKLLPTAFTINTNGNYRNLTIYTAWDRTGLNTNQLYGYYDKVRPENNAIYCTIGEDITTYSSAESRVVNPNTNTSITRWLNPKTMGEKGQWLSTSLLKQWFVGYDDENGCFKGIQFNDGDQYAAEINAQSSTSNALLKFSAASKENPCFLLEDPAIKFKPTLLVGVFPSVTAADFATNTNRIHFNVETEIVCTYRGLRKARVISSTTEQGQQLIVAPKPTAIEANGTYYANTDGFNGYSSVTVAVPQSGGTTVNNADVAPNDYNIIRANGSFQIPQGKTGWNSFSVQVPDSGSGGDDSQIPENRLSVILSDDAVATAQDRTDAMSNGVPLRNYIDWPKAGQVDWTNITTIPQNDAKWVDSALIDVSNVHLAEKWSQASPLSLNHVHTTYKQGHDASNSTYPEDFNFTTESGIKFNNDNTLVNDLVTLRNQYVNCISTDINVGDISSPTYTNIQPTPQEIQDEIDANPILQPSTHGAYVETIDDPTPQNPNHKKQVIHFTFELTDGQQTKTAPSSGMDVDPIALPRLYARKMQGYFNLPTIAKNITITEPGEYAIGNFIGNQNILEVEPVNSNGNVSELPNELKLIKTRDSNPNENEFSLGTFTVDIPSQSQDNNATDYVYTLRLRRGGTLSPVYTNLEIVEPLAYKEIATNGLDQVEFYGYNYEGSDETLNDTGKWACIYWYPNYYYGCVVFNVESTTTGITQTFNLENRSGSVPLRRILFQIYDENEDFEYDGNTWKVDKCYFTALCNSSGQKILPLSNSVDFAFTTYNGSPRILLSPSEEIYSLPNTDEDANQPAFNAPYDPTLYNISATPFDNLTRKSLTGKNNKLRK